MIRLQNTTVRNVDSDRYLVMLGRFFGQSNDFLGVVVVADADQIGDNRINDTHVTMQCNIYNSIQNYNEITVDT